MTVESAVKIAYTDAGSTVAVSAAIPKTNISLLDSLLLNFNQLDSVTCCLSGGVDSQFSLWLALQSGIKVQLATYAAIWDDNIVNSQDVLKSMSISKALNLPLKLIDINLKEYLESGAYIDTAVQYKTDSPQIATHLAFLNALSKSLDTEAVLMGGDPPLAAIISDTDNLDEFSVGLHNAKGYYTRIFAPYVNYANSNNLHLLKDLFYSTPETFYLAVKHNIDVIKNTGMYLNVTKQHPIRISSHIYRTEYYKQLGANIEPQLVKNTGFETVKKHLASLTGNYDEFDQQYRNPLEHNLRQFSWYRNFTKATALDNVAVNTKPIFDEISSAIKCSDNLIKTSTYSFDF